MKCRSLFVFVLLLTGSTMYAQRLNNESEHLGQQVNSEAAELGPLISPDGRTLYFVREGHRENKGYEDREDDQDIWYSTATSNGHWTEARNLGAPLNDKYPNGIEGISTDGTTALVFLYYKDGKPLKDGYSISRKTKSGWGIPVGIEIPGYEELNKGTMSTASLSADGQMLFLTFSPNEDNSDYDIYYSERVSELHWSEPKRLAVCSASNEVTPFLSADNETLYFSSDRPGGLGSFDVYVTRRVSRTWDEWTEPVNCGPSINSEGGDIYYTIPASGSYAYFVSNGAGGSADIYRVELPDSLRPKPVVLIKGRIVDAKTGEPLETDVHYEVLPGGEEVGIAHANPETGYYEIILPYGRSYGFYAKKAGYYPVAENLDLTDLTSYREIEKNLALAPIERGAVIRLNNLFFDFNKSELRSASYPELDRLVVAMNERPAMKIRVHGHTDNIGTAPYNLGLSKRRARAVYDYLVSRGIASGRVRIKAFGLSKPVATNETEEGRQLNRRGEFQVLEK